MSRHRRSCRRDTSRRASRRRRCTPRRQRASRPARTRARDARDAASMQASTSAWRARYQKPSGTQPACRRLPADAAECAHPSSDARSARPSRRCTATGGAAYGAGSRAVLRADTDGVLVDVDARDLPQQEAPTLGELVAHGLLVGGERSSRPLEEVDLRDQHGLLEPDRCDRFEACGEPRPGRSERRRSMPVRRGVPGAVAVGLLGFEVLERRGEHLPAFGQLGQRVAQHRPVVPAPRGG